MGGEEIGWEGGGWRMGMERKEEKEEKGKEGTRERRKKGRNDQPRTHARTHATRKNGGSMAVEGRK